MEEYNLRVSRDEDGNLTPVEGESPTLGIPVKVIPITYGQSRRIEAFGKPIIEWTDEEKLMVLKENLVEPDEFYESDVTVEDFRNNYEAYKVEDLVQAVVVYSGLGHLFDRAKGKVMEEIEEKMES